jgi:uncharacterized membrane protein YhaH (DUF805 family)
MKITFEGRINRLQFLASILIIGVPVFLISELVNYDFNNIIFIISIFISLLVIFPITQRFHDLNLSGWYTLIVLIPILSIIPMLFLLFWPGTKGHNKYKSSTKNHEVAVNNISESDLSTEKNEFNDLSITKNNSSEDQYFEIAWNEVTNSNPKKALWAQAFASNKGAENPTKADYINKRVEELKLENSSSKGSSNNEELPYNFRYRNKIVKHNNHIYFVEKESFISAEEAKIFIDNQLNSTSTRISSDAPEGQMKYSFKYGEKTIYHNNVIYAVDDEIFATAEGARFYIDNQLAVASSKTVSQVQDESRS